MKSRRLFLIASLATMASCGKNRSASKRGSESAANRNSEWEGFTEPMRLASRADVVQAVRNAKQSARAVIFVHVDWSTDPYFVGPTFMEFCEAYNSIRGLPAIGFHYIDCTSVTDGYLPLRNLDGWKELESKEGGGSLIHGRGEVAWLNHGRAVAVERINYDATPADLLRQTLSTFEGGT